MAPVIDTRTERTHEDCVCDPSPWWEHAASLLPMNTIPRSAGNGNTTMQLDYQYRGEGTTGNTRHGANNDRSPAVGTGLSVFCYHHHRHLYLNQTTRSVENRK